ncbi:Rgg/GadR/MutR family transcriptional regulator [Lactococcus formosensis]|uniref:Helix-turn-helix domain-containing protein n=1 Tax=Lactococcus formosensis TaxID=1281486 RepID=A0A9X4PE96_9LACT|nr:Rgg/GadR/MutR family transcriptional regulator [Lactococcus formosensis]MDG6126612.1 helix-turn-helix domain-containing protein [Lactococcus formosensis]MDG6131700.1 helix-turn-helix domain-containing protein [Lactococcus formosensis]MDG6133698.1 helix-turn-helix domain-containing protein [Lactococcus formosensis]MDG6140676.1 helix-turn-helix domain-containing protein [Lactococcus formosensis]MDG6146317.1 helix-turn-helix domain-containing protein [Lactococcus formosensis]
MSISELNTLSGVSKATISQFENGKSLMSFDKLEALLEYMNLTILDYSLLVNNGLPEYFIMQFQNIEDAYYNQDEAELHQLYEKNLEYEDESTYMIALSAKATYTQLSEKEIQEVESLLSLGPLWGLYELYILIHTLEQLNMNLVWNIIETFFKNKNVFKYLKVLHEYRALLITILIKAELKFIEADCDTKAGIVLSRMNGLTVESDLTSKLIIRVLKGCYTYAFESKSNGEKIIADCLEFVDNLEAIKLKKIISQRFILLKSRVQK